MDKHVLVISQYFYPEEFRINDICKEWVKKGYKVTVITGIPNYPQGKFFKGYGLTKRNKETYEGIDIVRLPIIPRGKKSFTLMLNYLSFVISGFFWQLFTRVKADCVFIFEVSPMTQALPGVWYSKKLNIPCYLYVQDLWPENVEIITGLKNKLIINAIGKMVDYIYLRCTRILTTSQSFVDSIVMRNVSKEKVEFWPQYAEEFYKPVGSVQIEEVPSDKRFNIIFAGNIGEAQGLEILPKAAAILSATHHDKVRFNIVGDGRYKEELILSVKFNNVESMFNFVPKQPAIRIPEFIAANDAAFLSLTNHPLFEKTIPAKLQSYMACGAPIIASASGETAQIIKNSRGGLYSDPGSAEELAKNILKLIDMNRSELEMFGYNSKKYSDEHFNKSKLLDRMDVIFNK